MACSEIIFTCTVEAYLSKPRLTSCSDYPAVNLTHSSQCSLINMDNVCDEMANDSSACGKRKRVVLSLESKLAILDRL